jgi:hypothetical protein
VYKPFDWNRLAFASQLAVGATALDVGSGNAALLSMLERTGKFKRLCGVDIRHGNAARRNVDAEFHTMSVTDLTFGENEFDSVFCMEVIEHLHPDHLAPALAHLRRVAGRRLVVTVPFNEPFPLYHQNRPSGHKQSFGQAELERLFPGGIGAEVPNWGVNWILIVEDSATPKTGLRILPVQDFCIHFQASPPVAVDELVRELPLPTRFRWRLGTWIPRTSRVRRVFRWIRERLSGERRAATPVKST